MKKLTLIISIIITQILIAKAQVVTYVYGITKDETPYKLFPDAARYGDFKAGEKLRILGIEKDHFKIMGNRNVYVLKSHLHNPDSIEMVFKREYALADSLDRDLQKRIEAEKISKKAALKRTILAELKKHPEYYSKLDIYCFENEVIKIGMKSPVLKYILGAPATINSTKLASSVSEQWVYEDQTYYYFTNDKLTAIQETKK